MKNLKDKNLLLLLVAFAALLGYILYSGATAPKYISIHEVHHVSLDGAALIVDLATTPAAREQGLSDRPNLPSDHGMLFVFGTPGKYAFWMKDMNFPIDMIWLDQNMRVIYIKADASPDSYPTAFAPAGPALYVLETPDGFSAAHNVRVGDQARFSK